MTHCEQAITVSRGNCKAAPSMWENAPIVGESAATFQCPASQHQKSSVEGFASPEAANAISIEDRFN